MSADNWAICPQCLAKAESAAKAEAERVQAVYGKVSIEEFDKRRERLKPVNPEDHRTFREDYEFYGAESGEVVADYSGACSTCGLSVEFSRKERFYEVREPVGGKREHG